MRSRRYLKTLLVGFLLITPVVARQRLWQHLEQKPVPELSAEEIVRLSATDSGDSTVIVDVRSENETSVSIIPGAITRAAFEQNIEQHRDKRVVIYCTVGVRSAAYARQLRMDGWDAWNYGGSILDWCDRKLPLVTSQGLHTNRVHIYSAWFSAPDGYESVY